MNRIPQRYPFLSEDEFHDACKALATRYMKFKAASAGTKALKAFEMTLNEQLRFLAFETRLQVDESSCTRCRHVCGLDEDIDCLDAMALEDEDTDSVRFYILDVAVYFHATRTDISPGSFLSSSSGKQAIRA